MSVNRAGKAVLTAVTLALTVMAQQSASTQNGQPSIACKLAKAAAPKKQTALPEFRPTAGIVTGGPHSTDFTTAYEMAMALGTGRQTGPHNEKAPRVIPIVGHGGIQSIVDLLILPGVDLAIAPVVLLNRMRDLGECGDIQNRLVFIAPAFIEEFHVLATGDIHSIRDLAGKTVNLGQKGTASAILGRELLDRLEVEFTELNVDLNTALDGMRNGQLSATLLLFGKPMRTLMTTTQLDGLHFIAIPYTSDLQKDYLPSALKHEDYPNLIGAGDSIDTVSISSVLMAYNWPSGSQGFDLLTLFVRTLASRLPELQTGSYHPKWRDVTLTATLPGWARFTPTEHNERVSPEAEIPEVKRFRHHDHRYNPGAMSLGWILFGPGERWTERTRNDVQLHTQLRCFRHRCEGNGSHSAWARRSR